MRKPKPPKSNLNHKLLMALKNLRNNDNIFSLKVDKYGATVVMDKNDSNSKMRYHLYNSGSYNKLHRNCISIVIKEVRHAIKELI